MPHFRPVGGGAQVWTRINSFRIFPSGRDTLERRPSVTSPTRIVGREPRPVCPAPVVVSVPYKPFCSWTTSACLLSKCGTLSRSRPYVSQKNVPFLGMSGELSAVRPLKRLRRVFCLGWAWDKVPTLVAGREN